VAKGETLLVEKPLIRLTPRLGSPAVRWYDEPGRVQAALGTLSCAAPKKTLTTWFDAQLDQAVCTNAFTLKCTAGSIHSYVFHRVSRFNHSCSPNAVLVCNPTAEHACIYATRDVPAGVELTLNYGADGALPERQQHLRTCFGFNCACARCTAEARHSTSEARGRTAGRAPSDGPPARPASSLSRAPSTVLDQDAETLLRMLAKHR
jgi:hypothetical protein